MPMKDVLQKYCITSYSRNGVNRMWIQTIQKIKSTTFTHLASIMYILFDLMIFQLHIQQFHVINFNSDSEIIRSAFLYKNGRYNVYQLHPFDKQKQSFLISLLDILMMSFPSIIVHFMITYTLYT